MSSSSSSETLLDLSRATRWVQDENLEARLQIGRENRVFELVNYVKHVCDIVAVLELSDAVDHDDKSIGAFRFNYLRGKFIVTESRPRI